MILGRLRRYLFTGLTVTLPVLLSGYIIVLIFLFFDNFLGKFIQPLFTRIFGFYFWGLSIVVSIILLLVVGFFVDNFLGRKIYPVVDSVLLRIPFFRQVYPAMKEIAAFLFSREKAAFKQVVVVEYPRKGIYSMGFLMNESPKIVCEKTGMDLVNIFVPTSPTPLSGFVILVPRSEVILTNITVEQAVKFFLSNGVVNPLDRPFNGIKS